MPARPAVLAIDLGTGSVRAALLSFSAEVLSLGSVGHPTLYPRHGWVEQRPEDWWAGTAASVRQALAGCADRLDLRSIVVCGQMHAPVLVNRTGEPVSDTVPLWNDKRSACLAASIAAGGSAHDLSVVANPATTAWPGIKLAWTAQAAPALLERARWLMSPKDFINFRLTGQVAMDWTEAGSSFLADMTAGTWSRALASRLGVPFDILPGILPSTARVGSVTSAAARATGLPKGLPVLVGAGDFPTAILGSGVVRPGQVSDITGTSNLMTRLAEIPVCNSRIMNIATATGAWGAFAVVDAAGDTIRWAARTLDGDKHSFDHLSREAATVPAGCDGLIFLPYLTGERLGQGAQSRAHFLGLTAQHSPAHLHRAIMEGVVLAMQEAFAPILGTAALPEVIVSTAGGARSELWLQIKADVFGVPVLPTAETEAGLLGSALLALAAEGEFGTAAEAATALVRYRPVIHPNPDRHCRYRALAEAYATLRDVSLIINQPWDACHDTGARRAMGHGWNTAGQ